MPIVIVPARVPPGWDVVAVPGAAPGSVKFDVVSALVFVIAVPGAGTSPGALIVDVTAVDV